MFSLLTITNSGAAVNFLQFPIGFQLAHQASCFWARATAHCHFPRSKKDISWLVVYLPLWKILGWDYYSQYMGKQKHFPNHQQNLPSHNHLPNNMCWYGFHDACSIIANESLHKHSFSQMATQAGSKRSNNSGWLKTAENHIVQPNLVGGWALPLWKMMEFVSWDDEIPNSNGKLVHSCSKAPTSH